MKNNLRIMLIITALGLVFGCATNSYAQENQPMVGGYSKIEVTDARVKSAANYAIQAEAKKLGAKIRLIKINNAAKQLVAGMNYKMCLKVVMTKAGSKTRATQFVEAVVYQKPDKEYLLTDWTLTDCANK